ncbi:MAG: hypothetical protein IT320_13850 [Anaerolineae bacterium]|nr:hypothetical protein [Anaerolineae bacterium]
MANQRHRRLMQEALDEQLSLDARQELYRQLDDTPEDAEIYSRLRQVDRLLRTAPMERAPERLALKIMAKLAEGLQTQKLSQTAGLALSLALALLALLMMPLLAALGWLILNSLGNAAVLSGLIKSLSSMLVYLMNGLQTLVESAQQLLQNNPQTPAAVLVLIPIALLWIARYVNQQRNDPTEDA